MILIEFDIPPVVAVMSDSGIPSSNVTTAVLFDVC
jgi:hypothetical protein